MKNIYIINAHQAWPFSAGRLNASLVQQAVDYLEESNYRVRVTTMSDDWDIDAEIANHLWADAVIVQTPVNWMGVPWLMKKYMDLVYTNGMDGRLCDGDGRTRSDPTKQYGSGGSLKGKRYLLSMTFNAPAAAFGDPNQVFFEGKGIDDLFWPMHLNFRFFGMQPMPSFACFDVLKNPSIEADFERWSKHLAAVFPPQDVDQ